GGAWDHVLNLFPDVFLVIPTLPLMIVIAAYAESHGVWVLITVITVTGWSYGARQLRSQALSLRNREFLDAARVRGERSLYIIFFEVLPNMTSLIVAIFLGAALYAVLAAAGLQFIGLGDTNDLSWGTMLYWAQHNGALLAGQPLWVIAPGLCIAALGGAFALVNYAFDEISPPAEIVSGEVRFEGSDMVTLDEEELRAIRWRRYSVVMQSAMNALNPVLTIRAQLKDAILAHEDMPSRKLRSRSEEVLRLVGIDPIHLKSYPHQLSGGMRQRSMIAMALVFEPELVIMDE